MEDSFKDVQDLDAETGARISKAFLQTKRTLTFRNFVPWQLLKMIAFNASVVASIILSERTEK